MTRAKVVSFLRGKRVRATLLNTAGVPLYGPSSVAISKGFITVGMTTNTQSVDAINQTNANGEVCILDSPTESLSNIGVEIEFCGVDFAFFEMITGQPSVLDDNGVVVGITESTDTNLSAVNFALEMWLGVSTLEAPVTGSQGQYGYVLLPRLGGGVISDVSVENGAINFKVTGMVTKNGSAWGVGPYKVDLTAGVPSTLRRAIKTNDHRRIQMVEVAPPNPVSGAIPLLDPAGAALTGITATPTAKVVALSPVPVGTDPMWYDFGDGTWDYTVNGSYSKTYLTAGTWTVTGYRGTSSYVKTGVVTT